MVKFKADVDVKVYDVYSVSGGDNTFYSLIKEDDEGDKVDEECGADCGFSVFYGSVLVYGFGGQCCDEGSD